MAGRRTLPVTLVSLGVLLAGCATYRAKPLTDAARDPSLVGPVPEQISTTITAVHHPRLATVTVDLSQPLGPDQVAILAVALQPAVRAIRSQRALAQAQVIQAGILPNPQLSMTADHPLWADDVVAALGASLSWEATSLIAVGTRKAAALANAEAIDLAVAWQEWQAAIGAKLTALRVVSLVEQVALGEEMLLFQQQRAARLKRSADAGLITMVDADAASDAVAEAAATIAIMRQEADHQRLALNRYLGLPPATQVTLHAAAFTARRKPPSADQMQKEVEQNRLDLVGLRRGYDSQEATVHAAVLGQFPKILLGLQRNRDTGAVNSVGFGLTIDLPLFDRNQGVIASEEATRERLYREYVERIFQARADIVQASTDLTALSDQQSTAKQTIARLATRLSDQESALAIGALDQASSDATRLAWLQKRLDCLRLEQLSREAMIACELASGRYLPENTP